MKQSTRKKIVAIGVSIALGSFAILGFKIKTSPNVAPTLSASAIEPGCFSCQTSSSSLGGLVLKTGLGMTFDFSLAPGYGSGTFTAELGMIDDSGHYLSPTFSCLDTIHYTAPSGEEARVHVFVDPAIGGTSESPTVVPAGFLSGDGSYTGGSSVALPDADGKWHAAAYADEEQEPTPTLTDCGDLDVVPNSEFPTTTGGNPPPSPAPDQASSASTPPTYVVPAYDGDAPVSYILLLAGPDGQGKPKKCKIGPLYPLPIYNGEDCFGAADRKVYGPLKTFSEPGPWRAGGKIEVKGSMGTTIKQIFNIEVDAGATFDLERKTIEWKQIQNYDIYGCVGGTWKYKGSGTCKRIGVGELTSPVWYAYFDGYPKNGAPSSWTPWACAAL